MISKQESQTRFNKYRETQGSQDEVYTYGTKMNERVGAVAVIKRHFQNGGTTSRQLSKTLPGNSTIVAVDATAIRLVLSYYQFMGPVHYNVVFYSNSISCLQAIEGKDTERPFMYWPLCSWTCSGYWVTRAHVFVSARYQAILLLGEMKKQTGQQKRALTMT